MTPELMVLFLIPLAVTAFAFWLCQIWITALREFFHSTLTAQKGQCDARLHVLEARLKRLEERR